MITICAWCYPGVSAPNISHTICERHKRDMLAGINGKCGSHNLSVPDEAAHESAQANSHHAEQCSGCVSETTAAAEFPARTVSHGDTETRRAA